eukprot:CAMPEP_0194268580 /NCGR_PEP_ID=MMETSP0169-20130528/2883_1 /TAXON_ID=218684 /ORGANISM="Corethron pennatum, Strain L29A3" /LENGTH=233 /DNA_ID=CAMNT_0039009861 /DNA_START=68 /DNA_END=769 /DNA_ORIENTATION=-
MYRAAAIVRRSSSARPVNYWRRRPVPLPHYENPSSHPANPSSRPFGILETVRDSLESRRESKESEKMKDQFGKLSLLDVFTLRAFLDEMSTGLSDWRSKLPGVRNNDQVKKLKKSQVILLSISEEIGPSATNTVARPMAALGRKEKLRVALRCGKSVEEVNASIGEFETMELMHAVIKKVMEGGGEVPETRQDMEDAMGLYATKVIPKKRLRAIAGAQAKKMGGGGGGGGKLR